MSPAPDAVVLDIDGTLVDANYQHTLAWQRAFAAVGVVVPAWRIHRAIGMGGDLLVAHVAGDEVEEQHGDAIRTGWKKEADALLAEIVPLDGATALLEAIRERGLTVALATSGKTDHTEHALDVLGARPLIDHLAGADDVEDSKPAPDLLGVAADAVDASHPVMVGDSVWDAEAARNASMPFLGLLTGGTSRDELLGAGAVAVYADPVDLTEHLDEALKLSAP